MSQNVVLLFSSSLGFIWISKEPTETALNPSVRHVAKAVCSIRG